MIFPNVIIEQFCHSWNTNMRFGNDCCGNDRVVFFFSMIYGVNLSCNGGYRGL